MGLVLTKNRSSGVPLRQTPRELGSPPPYGSCDESLSGTIFDWGHLRNFIMSAAGGLFGGKVRQGFVREFLDEFSGDSNKNFTPQVRRVPLQLLSSAVLGLLIAGDYPLRSPVKLYIQGCRQSRCLPCRGERQPHGCGGSTRVHRALRTHSLGLVTPRAQQCPPSSSERP